MNPETFGGIRDFIYYGGEDNFDSVKNNTQKTYFNFMTNPKIKQALGKPTDINIQYNKTKIFGDNESILNSPRGEPNIDSTIDIKGEQGRISYNLAGIWNEVTGGKKKYNTGDDDKSNKILRKDRLQFSELAAYELRLETHAALMSQNRNPDFLIGHHSNKSKSDNGDYFSDPLSRETVTSIFENLIANDSFNERPPEVPKSRNNKDKYGNSDLYTQERQMGVALSALTNRQGRNYDPHDTESVCQDKPCQNSDGSEKNLKSLLKDYFASHKQLVYTAYLGKASDSKTKKANAKMEAVLSRLSLPTQRPKPTQTPEHTPTTEEPTSVATSSPEPV
jgi:hypothetical protein